MLLALVFSFAAATGPSTPAPIQGPRAELSTPSLPPCAVPLYREYDPTRPPRLPGVGWVPGFPYIDVLEPAGTSLVFYAVHARPSEYDPDPSPLLVIKSGAAAELVWAGRQWETACCMAGACTLLCPDACAAAGGHAQRSGSCGPGLCERGACCVGEGRCMERVEPGRCADVGGVFAGARTECATIPSPCAPVVATGACCDMYSNCRDSTTPFDCGGTYMGDGTFCGQAPPLCQYSGACCLSGGCRDSADEGWCHREFGLYLGDGTFCGNRSESCASRVGACCRPVVGCEESIPQRYCESNGWVYLGDGSRCSTASCDAVTGACCYAGYGCEEGYTDRSCFGVYLGDQVSCSAGACDGLTGACCSDLGCEDGSSMSACDGAPGGQFMGLGTTCPAACASLFGACCVNGCNDRTAASCTSLGGVFSGAGTSCASGPPCVAVTGACCQPEVGCEDLVSAARCADDGGTYQGDGTRCAGTCAGTGACCVPSGAAGVCEEGRLRGYCERSGVYLGDGSQCSTVDCATRTGACCVAWGCHNGMGPDLCASYLGSFLGEGTTCAPGVCDGEVGACCMFARGCDEFPAAYCTDYRRGAYLGDGTTCSASPGGCAAATGACCIFGFGCTDGVPQDLCAIPRTWPIGPPGTYAGDGTTCASLPGLCDIGACCLAPGTCEEFLSPSECSARGGTLSPGLFCADTGC